MSSNAAPDADLDVLEEPLIRLLEQYHLAVTSGEPWDENLSAALTETQRTAWEAAAQALQLLAKAGPSHAMSADRSPTAYLPTCIGRYHIERIIGAGGFAVVYLGRDPYTDRLVAVKIPQPQVLLSADLRKCFVREAQAAAKLDHPNIVPLFEAGLDGDLPYLVSSYCDGPTLGEWIKQRSDPLPIRAAIELIRQLALAVQYSHEQGILHRDITPGNVLLVPQTSSADAVPFIPRLADFGLAKLLESDLDESASSALLGTPAYMAPEQALRGQRTSGVHVDVYGLGALFYFLLTRRAPFERDTAWDTLVALRESEPVSPRVLRPGIPLDVETICLKCLERDPACRYSTAGDLAADLDRYSTGHPILARRASWGRQIWQWCRRHPGVAALSAAMLITVATLVSSLAVYSVYAQRLNLELSRHANTLARMVSQLNTALTDKSASQKLAEDRAQQLRQTVYSIEVNRAAAAWKRGDVRMMNAILKPFNQLQPDDVDLREFGWYYLWKQQSVEELFRLQTPAAQYSAQFSPDGSLAAFAGQDSVVRIVSTAERRVIHEIATLQKEVNFALFGPQAEWLATAGDNGTVALWEIPSGQCQAVWPVFDGKTAFQLAFSNPLKLLAVCGHSPSVVLLDATTGTQVGLLPGQDESDVEAITISPDGRWLLESRSSKCAVVWDLSSRQAHHRLVGFDNAISAGAWSPDGRYVAVGSLDGQIKIFDATTGQLVRDHRLIDSVQSLTWSSDVGLFVGDRGGQVTVLRDPTVPGSASDNQVVARWSLHQNRLYGLASSRDAAMLATASRDRTVGLFRPNRTPAVTLRESASIGEVTLVAPLVGPDRHGLHFGISLSGLYRVESAADASNLVLVDRRRFDDAQLVGDTQLLTTSEGSLFRWDTTAEVRLIDKHQAFPDGLLMLTVMDGDHVFIRRNLAEMGLWNLPSGKFIEHWPGCSAVAITPDRRYFALANGVTHGFVVYETATRQPIWTAAKHTEVIVDLCFDRHGQRVFSSSGDRSVIAWDMFHHRPLFQLYGHEARVNLVTLSPDERTLATADVSGNLRLWDLRSRNELFVLYQHDREFQSLEFSSDGQELVAWDKQMRFYHWSIRREVPPSSPFPKIADPAQ